MEVTNNGTRTFLVRKDQVLKGGSKMPDKAVLAFEPGETIEVVDSLGKFLCSYPEVTGKRKPVETKNDAPIVPPSGKGKGKK